MSINLHRFRYEPIDDLHGKVYIDEKQIRTNAVDCRLRVDEVPSVKINLLGNFAIETMAEIGFSDENLLEMVKKKMSDCEFRRCLYWVIEEWKNMQS